MQLEPGELESWVRAFAFTQCVEVPLYVACLSWPRLMRGMALWKRVALAFLCSLLTHPVVWFVFPRLIDSYYYYAQMVVAAETFAVTAEALILSLFGMRWRWALLASLVTNMTSMSLGFLFRYLFSWF
jgi:NhaP-type Na+/H+ or K+/H+ antiporter